MIKEGNTLRHMTKTLAALLVFLLIAANLATVGAEEQQEQRFVLTFVGDCTLGTLPGQFAADVGMVKTVGGDYGYPFRNVMAYFSGDDATFINLEGALTDEGYPSDKTYNFRGPTDFINILTQSSVELASLANNHTRDYGQVGYDSTRNLLEEAEIPYVERDSSRMITLDGGLKIGIYGMVYYMLDLNDMKSEIAALREQGAELVIVAPHWGYEGNYHPNQEQITAAHEAIDAGADIVWGSHPHVLQPVEEYNGGIIYYSMANFCFGGNGCPDDFDTALLQQEVIRSPEGTITLGELTIVPCSISSDSRVNNFQPTPLEPGTEEYNRVISKLDGSFTGPNLKV